MKTFLQSAACAIMFLFIVVGSPAPAAPDEEGWKVIREGISINSGSVAYPSPHIASLWVRIVPEKDSSLYVAARTALRAGGRNYRAYRYTAFLTEIDCSRNSHRELSIIFYTRDRNIIHAVDGPGSGWKDILSDGSFSLIRNAVCKEEQTAAIGGGSFDMD